MKQHRFDKGLLRPTHETIAEMRSAAAWSEALPHRRGKSEYIKHLQGKKLTQRQRINAVCYCCSAWYDTGNYCTSYTCPLQPLNPYVLAKCKANLRNRGEANGTGGSNPQP